MARKVICPYCGAIAQYVDSAVIYGGTSYGMKYWCEPCDAYVGVHKGTDRPFGTLANTELRNRRRIAHLALSFIEKKIGRRKAYKWLADVMGKSEDETHIGLFNVEDCDEVVRCVQREHPETRNEGSRI